MTRFEANDRRLAVDLTTGFDIDASLGGKGRSLASLVASGVPVPRTGVVTTYAYHRMAEQPEVAEALMSVRDGQGFERVQEALRSDSIPDDLADEITDLALRIGGGGPIAVRSSATVEDMHGSSFAGQYTSLLDIDSGVRDEVLDAVCQVWASLWRPAAVAYRQAFGIADDDVAMAVVLMQMVAADRAGVVFTEDPGGAPGCARVESVEGLGESLVSGEATPNAWVVLRQDPDGLPECERRALRLALEIEQTTGTPQDVEWAAASEQVFVVQARPITVLEQSDGFDSDVDNHELTTAGIVEMVPGVLPPLRWETNRFLLEEAFRSVLDGLGILGEADTADEQFIRRVRGRAALDFDRMRSAASLVPGAVERLEHEYFGTSDPPPKQRGGANGVSSLVAEARALRTRHVMAVQADVVIGTAQELRKVRPELADLDDQGLLRYRRRLVDQASRGLAAELAVAAAGAAAYERLRSILEGHLGPQTGARAALSLVAGAGLEEIRDVDSSAAVFAGPTWAELGARPPEPGSRPGTNNEVAVEKQLQSLPGWKRRRLLTGQVIDVRIHLIRRIASEAKEQLSRREAAKAAVLYIGGEVRRVEFELGRRLTSRRLIQSADQIELLSGRELVDLVAGTTSLTPDVLGRRANWLSRYEAEGTLPLRFSGVPDRTPEPLPEGDLLEGWAASPGRYRGVARVVTSSKGPLKRGEILVAEATDASWSPLFVRAGAVIVERGGPLSHAAILARELGLPAVLNIPGATHGLEGATVTVDGDQGVIVIERPGTSP